MKSIIILRINTILLVLTLSSACEQKQMGTENPNPKLVTEALMVAVDDTNTKQSYPNQSKGTSHKIDVSNLAGSIKQGFLKFNLSEIPQSTVIQRATLRLSVYKVIDPGVIDLYIVNGRWDEISLTYNNSDSLELYLYTSQMITEADEHIYVDLDITDLVHSWVSGQTVNDGLALVADGNPIGRIEFYSKEALDNPTYLELVY